MLFAVLHSLDKILLSWDVCHEIMNYRKQKGKKQKKNHLHSLMGYLLLIYIHLNSSHVFDTTKLNFLYTTSLHE